MRLQRDRRWRIGVVAAAAAGLLGGSPPATPPPARPAPAPAPACRAEADPADAAAVAALIEALRRLPPRRSADGEPVVTLDNRGYAYDPGPPPFPGLAVPPER